MEGGSSATHLLSLGPEGAGRFQGQVPSATSEASKALAKKDKKKKQSSGSFFAPKDVVRIGDEDPNATKQGQTRGPNFRNKTRTASLLGGSVNKKTLVGS